MNRNYSPIERQLIKNAWYAQDACNLSGLLHSFLDDMRVLHDNYRDMGTEFFNRHLMTQLYAEKLADLAGEAPSNLPEFIFE